MYINQCFHCDRDFQVKYKSQHRPDKSKTFKKYCSKDCRSKVQSINLTTRNLNKPKKVKVKQVFINNCVVCLSDFEVYDKEKNNQNNKKQYKKCCSPECLSVLRSKTAKETASKADYKVRGEKCNQTWLKKMEERAGLTLDEAVLLYTDDGLSLNQIAETYGFSRDRMSVELKRREIVLDNHYKETNLKVEEAIKII